MRRISLVLILLVTVTASPSAYVRYAKWTGATATFYLNPANADNGLQAGRTNANVLASLQTALTTWSAAGSAFRFSYGGPVSDTVIGHDYRNVALFRNTANPNNATSIATTYSWWGNGLLKDSDVIFWDGRVAFYTDATLCGSTIADPTHQRVANAAALVDIAVHEFGHALGLSHTPVVGASMHVGYNYCTKTMRSLESDDVAGLKFLYPPVAIR